MIYLAGIPVTERLVLELARRLRAAELHTTAGKLEHATAVEARPPTSVRNVSLRALATSRRSRHPIRKSVPHSCPKRLETTGATMPAAVPGSPANPHGCRGE